MKKLWQILMALCLSLALMFSLVGCWEKETPDPTPGSETTEPDAPTQAVSMTEFALSGATKLLMRDNITMNVVLNTVTDIPSTDTATVKLKKHPESEDGKHNYDVDFKQSHVRTVPGENPEDPPKQESNSSSVLVIGNTLYRPLHNAENLHVPTRYTFSLDSYVASVLDALEALNGMEELADFTVTETETGYEAGLDLDAKPLLDQFLAGIEAGKSMPFPTTIARYLAGPEASDLTVAATLAALKETLTDDITVGELVTTANSLLAPIAPGLTVEQLVTIAGTATQMDAQTLYTLLSGLLSGTTLAQPNTGEALYTYAMRVLSDKAVASLFGGTSSEGNALTSFAALANQLLSQKTGETTETPTYYSVTEAYDMVVAPLLGMLVGVDLSSEFLSTVTVTTTKLALKITADKDMNLQGATYALDLDITVGSGENAMPLKVKIDGGITLSYEAVTIALPTGAVVLASFVPTKTDVDVQNVPFTLVDEPEDSTILTLGSSVKVDFGDLPAGDYNLTARDYVLTVSAFAEAKGGDNPGRVLRIGNLTNTGAVDTASEIGYVDPTTNMLTFADDFGALLKAELAKLDADLQQDINENVTYTFYYGFTVALNIKGENGYTQYATIRFVRAE